MTGVDTMAAVQTPRVSRRLQGLDIACREMRRFFLTPSSSYCIILSKPTGFRCGTTAKMLNIEILLLDKL